MEGLLVETVVETVPAGLVDEVHFADGGGGVAALAEVVRDGWDAVGKSVLEDFGAVFVGVLTGD